MADNNQKAEEARKRAAEAADAAVARRGQEIAAQARASVNQPMKPPMTLDEACQLATDAGERIIVVAVPHKYVLLLDFARQQTDERGKVTDDGHYLGSYWGSRLEIPEGAQQMPVSVAEHWWSRQHGVKLYTPPKIKPSEPTYSKADMDAAIAKAREEWAKNPDKKE